MTDTSTEPVHVIGGGLAGSEAAWQIARMGVPVIIHEMRPARGTDARSSTAARYSGRLGTTICRT